MVTELLGKCANSGTAFHRNIKNINRSIEAIDQGYVKPSIGEKEPVNKESECHRIKLLAVDMIIDVGTMQTCGIDKGAISSRKDMTTRIIDHANKQDINAIKKEIRDFEIYNL